MLRVSSTLAGTPRGGRGARSSTLCASLPGDATAARTIFSRATAVGGLEKPTSAAFPFRMVAPGARVVSSSTSSTAHDLQCAGCGVHLQTRDKVAAGYIPSLTQLEELKKRSEEAAAKDSSFAGHSLVCQRCFTAKHYGKLMPLNIPQEAWSAYVKALSQLQRGLIVLVVDGFDVHDTLAVLSTAKELLASAGTAAAAGNNGDGSATVPLLERLNRNPEAGVKIFASSPEATARLTRNRNEAATPTAADTEPPSEIPILVVVNKVDLLPSSLSHARLEAWIRGQINSLESSEHHRQRPNYHYRVVGVHCVSAAKRYGIRDLVQTLQKHKNDPIRPQLASRTPSPPQSSSSSTRGDVYIIGAPNTGKSTLINAILSEVWHTPMPDKSRKQAEDDEINSGQRHDEGIGIKPLRPEDDPDVLVPEVTASAAAGGVEASVEVDDDSHDLKGKKGALSSLVFSLAELTAARKSLDDKYSLSPHKRGTQPAETELVAEVLRLRRKRVGDDKSKGAAGRGGSGGGSISIDKDTSSLLDEVLAGHIARKKNYRKTKGTQQGTASGSNGGGSAASQQYDAVEAVLNAQKAERKQQEDQEVAGGKDDSDVDADADAGAAGAAPPSSSLPAPPIPFTTSPLPGTTLGLLGAQLDPHGHSRIWDTPGLIVNEDKQALLESVAAVPLDQQQDGEGLVPSSTTDDASSAEAAASSNKVRPIVFAATSRLSALVPGPSSSTGGLLRSSPSTRAPVPSSSSGAGALANARVYKLVPGRSLYLGGLARIDYDHLKAPRASSPIEEASARRHRGSASTRTNRDGSISLDIGGDDDDLQVEEDDGFGASRSPSSGVKAQLPSLLVTVCSRLTVHLTRSDGADLLWLRHCAQESLFGQGDGIGAEGSGVASAVDLFTGGGRAKDKAGHSSNDIGLLRPYYKPLTNVGAVSLLRWANPLQVRAVVEGEAFAAAKRLLLADDDASMYSQQSFRSRFGNTRDGIKAAERALQDAVADFVTSGARSGTAPPLSLRRIAGMDEARSEVFRAEEKELAQAYKGFQPLVKERVQSLLSQAFAGRPLDRRIGSLDAIERRLHEASIINPTSSATINRRKKRTRHNLVDLALGGLGWVSVTPIEVEGMFGWGRTVNGAVLGVAVSDGVSAVARKPLIGDTATGLSSQDWGQ